MQPTQGTFLGITPVSSVSNGLYLLTLPLVSVMRVTYTSKGMSKSLGCALYIRCALSIKIYGIYESCEGGQEESESKYMYLTVQSWVEIEQKKLLTPF